MNVAIDLDGVLLDTLGRFCEIYNLFNKDEKTKDDITRFGFFEDWGMPEEEFWALFECCQLDEIKPIDKKAPNYIKKIAEIRNVDIVCARAEKDRDGVEKALKTIGLIKGVHYNNLLLTLKDNLESKIHLPYDLYIDDNPKLAKDVQKNYGKHILLWQQPWNWKIHSIMGVHRVRNWKEIYKKIKNNNLYI